MIRSQCSVSCWRSAVPLHLEPTVVGRRISWAGIPTNIPLPQACPECTRATTSLWNVAAGTSADLTQLMESGEAARNGCLDMHPHRQISVCVGADVLHGMTGTLWTVKDWFIAPPKWLQYRLKALWPSYYNNSLTVAFNNELWSKLELYPSPLIKSLTKC